MPLRWFYCSSWKALESSPRLIAFQACESRIHGQRLISTLVLININCLLDVYPLRLVAYLPSLFLMFNFSANHLLLLSRMEYRSCVVFLMKDDSTRRVYRLYDFTKSQVITSDHYYCVSGKVNNADKLYLVIESVRRDTKHSPDPQLRLEWTAREKCS